ncbi:MAG: TIGR03663 family protein, partial [Thermomicrobiales bacterium]|nr:TIGR03663 family protein [Thermomicrobiales bacterium]
MAEGTLDGQTQPAPILDRTINLTAISWTVVAWVIVLATGLAIRVAQLGHHPLSSGEARLAGDAYRFIRGQTGGPGNALPDTGPTAILLESLALFLFGDSDGVARLAPALLGVTMLGMLLLLRPVVGRYRALGMAVVLSLSPTVVYLSRVASHEIFVAAFGLLALVAFLRIGVEGAGSDRTRVWALLAGVALAALYGSGPSSLNVLIAIVFAGSAAALLDNRPDGAFRSGFTVLASSREAILYLAAGFAVTLVTLFSRFFSDFSALAGLGGTLADWGRLVATASTPTPTQFFLLAILLYELLAVVFAIVASMQSPRESQPPLTWSFFALWFAASLLIFSFSSGGLPEHAIHVALPLVLLGGSAVGDGLERLEQSVTRGAVWSLALVMIGLVIAIFAEVVMLGRIDDAAETGQAVFEAMATIVIALIPLAAAAFTLGRGLRLSGEGRSIGLAALVAAFILFGAITVRSSVMLSLFNSDESSELLAQRTSTPAVNQIVHRITNLSRDTTLPDGSARDPEGGHGLTIAIDRRVQWPFRWYFRDFPDATVVADGQTPLSGAQVVIAPDDTGLADAGYTSNDYPTQNRVPGSYLAPDFDSIISDIFVPSHWESGVRFLLYREQDSTAQPSTVTVGMTGELANRITPNTGPFNLFDQAGAGSGRGQFNQPRGVAVSPDGERIYVVDMANARVEIFDIDGTFIDVWGGEDDPDVTFAKTDSGLGPTGIAVGPDGLVYVCDTWNHRVVVLDESGNVVREFGAFADTLDSPDSSPEPGFFFGPRAIAVANDEIFVVDTGNERVQV